jgi:hypothetical protein
MKRGSVRWFPAVLIALVAAGVSLAMAVQARMPKGTDAEQIRLLVERGERAIEARELGAVMALISTKYKDSNGFQRDTARYAIGRAMRDSENIEITIPERSLQIRVAPDGQHATLACDVTITTTPRSTGGTVPYQSRVTIELAKEPAKIFGVFPTETWRVTSAEGYGAFADMVE